MTFNLKPNLSKIMSATLIAASLTLASCGTVIDQHGYVAEVGAVEDISKGMRKSEVKDILGSPNITTTESGLSYYYISSKQNRYTLVGDKTIERNVVAIHFNKAQRVSKIAHYGLKDGVLHDFVANETPTHQKDKALLERLFGSIGIFAPKLE